MEQHDDVIKWKHFSRYWPSMRGIHRWPVNSPQKGQWRGAKMFSLICTWINGWLNNREAGDLRRHRTHYDVIVMKILLATWGIVTIICVSELSTLAMVMACLVPRHNLNPCWLFVSWETDKLKYQTLQESAFESGICRSGICVGVMS